MSSAGFWRQAGTIAARDLRIETRVGEALLITLPFGAVALLVLPLAVGPEIPLLSRVGLGAYWTVVLLFGMLVALRQTAAEGPAQRDLLALLGLDPAARFAGQATASGVLLLAFEILLWPVMVVLYDPEGIRWVWIPLVWLLVGAGLSMLGTFAGALTANLRVRASLSALLVAPLAVPLLLGATVALSDFPPTRDILPWVLLLVTFDLVLAIVGVWSARPLEEGSR